jgi:hypothetical protein
MPTKAELEAKLIACRRLDVHLRNAMVEAMEVNDTMVADLQELRVNLHNTIQVLESRLKRSD